MGPALNQSPNARFEDPGYYRNNAALEELLNKNLVYWLYDPDLRNTMRTIGQAWRAVEGGSDAEDSCGSDPLRGGNSGGLDLPIREKPGMNASVTFVADAPLPEGFHHYRVRYKIHYANGVWTPKVTTLDARSPEHAKEKIRAFERYKADGPNYPNIESSITISFEEPEILKD
jgi:hypothetical protein